MRVQSITVTSCLLLIAIQCVVVTSIGMTNDQPSIQKQNNVSDVIIGTGDGRIHIIPSQSPPSVKNGVDLDDPGGD